jgi:hypothetical protein
MVRLSLCFWNKFNVFTGTLGTSLAKSLKRRRWRSTSRCVQLVGWVYKVDDDRCRTQKVLEITKKVGGKQSEELKKKLEGYHHYNLCAYCALIRLSFLQDCCQVVGVSCCKLLKQRDQIFTYTLALFYSQNWWLLFADSTHSTHKQHNK